MFKIDKLHSVFDCKACDRILEDPIVLPCGETICKKDLDGFPIENNEIECKFCMGKHVQSESGFPTDKRIQKMLKIQLDQLVFESMFENCRNVLNELNYKVQELSVMENDPDYYIYEYFSKIINQVDTIRESLKMNIDIYYYDVISEIKKMENACKMNAKKIKEFTSNLESSKKCLNELNKKFDLSQLNGRNLNQISREANHLKPKIIEEIKECQWYLLDNQTYTFEPVKVNIESIFGIFKCNERKKTDSYTDYINSGNKCYENENFNEAIAFHDKAIELEPTFSDAYFYKGNALHSLKQYEDAINCYDKSIKYDSTDYEAYANKGSSYNSLGKYEEALVCYERALNLKPDYALAISSKANTLNSIGNYNEALVYYDKVIEIDQNNSLAYFNKGVTLHKLGKFEEEISCYEVTLKLDPGNMDAYYYKANVLCVLKRYEEAVECFNECIKLDPNNSEIYNCKGEALNCIEKFVEALACFNKAIELNPGQNEFYKNKRFALTSLGRSSEALTCYNLFNV